MPRSGSPISPAEHIIPSDAMPRSFTGLIARPEGITAPTVATTTSKPALTFAAPQTICRTPEPTSTLQTFSLSASGCFSHSKTLPKTIFFGTLYSCTLSTSKPMELNVFAISSVEIPLKSIHSFNQLLVTIIETAPVI